MTTRIILGLCLFVTVCCISCGNVKKKSATTTEQCFEEVNGKLEFEAEAFYKQTITDKRKWYITTAETQPSVTPDADSVHLEGASGNAYVEVLPDTRHTHDDVLIKSDNYSDVPGEMAILHYKVKFNQAGRYYIWIRAFSSNSEDDAVHVGLDGEWPENSMRWRTTINYEWGWSRNRRFPPKVHEKGKKPLLAYMDVEKTGERELQISMREDGAELDKVILVMDENYVPE